MIPMADKTSPKLLVVYGRTVDHRDIVSREGPAELLKQYPDFDISAVSLEDLDARTLREGGYCQVAFLSPISSGQAAAPSNARFRRKFGQVRRHFERNGGGIVLVYSDQPLPREWFDFQKDAGVEFQGTIGVSKKKSGAAPEIVPASLYATVSPAAGYRQ